METETCRDAVIPERYTQAESNAYLRGIEHGIEAALNRLAVRADTSRPLPAEVTIYFIGEAGGGPVKIGFAVNVKSRLATLRTQSPAKLVLLASVVGHPRLERAYHRQFAAHRLHGEWFARAPEIEAEIARLSPTPLTATIIGGSHG